MELYSLNTVSFIHESSLPFDCTIRSAIPYSRREKAANFSEDIFSKINTPEKPSESGLRDVILCTTDTGEMVVVDWDLGRDAIQAEGRPGLKPGLRAVTKIRQARQGKDTTSLGRFIKLSAEYVSVYQS